MQDHPQNEAGSSTNNNARENHLNIDTAAYWKANLRLLGVLLSIWFVVSFGFGIILADWLDQFSLLGFKLGFWFAQQGAIYAFIVLIFVYRWRMKIIEREFGISEERDI